MFRLIFNSALFSLLLLAGIVLPAHSAKNRIVIVYNNIQGQTDRNLVTAGGFGAWVENEDNIILFDTGGDPDILLRNMKALKLDVSKIGTVVISHIHWDHLGGLAGVLEKTSKKPQVYVPVSVSKEIEEQYPGIEVKPADQPEQIVPGVWSSGELQIRYRDGVLCEQALIIEGGQDLFIVTGCAHPGIVSIIERAKKLHPGKKVALVTGGFHLRSHDREAIVETGEAFRRLDVERVGSSHCTGSPAMTHFQAEWKSGYIQMYLGDSFTWE